MMLSGTWLTAFSAWAVTRTVDSTHVTVTLSLRGFMARPFMITDLPTK